MRLFCFKTVSDPTNDNSVSGSNVPRDQLLKVARQTVIFFFFFAYSHISNPRDSTKPVSSTFKRYSFIAILFSCTERIRSYFKPTYHGSIHDILETKFWYRKREQKRGREKFIAREKYINLFHFQKVKEKERKKETVKRKKSKRGPPESIRDDFRNGGRRNIRVSRRKRVRPLSPFGHVDGTCNYA